MSKLFHAKRLKNPRVAIQFFSVFSLWKPGTLVLKHNFDFEQKIKEKNRLISGWYSII